jgi:hypothetical protein
MIQSHRYHLVTSRELDLLYEWSNEQAEVERMKELDNLIKRIEKRSSRTTSNTKRRTK